MSGQSVSVAVKDLVQQLGAGFMFSREAKEFGETTGVPGFIGPYMRGRCGVLGDVDADVVSASVGFIEPAAVRLAWESVTMPPAEAAAGYAHAAQEFGRRKLGSFGDAARLAELLQAVSDAAEVGGVPLFAGWRALPLPSDGPARALQLTHILRELRGGLHFLAVTAAGLSPLESVLIGGSPLASGDEQARRFGYAEPFPEITAELRERWAGAEAVTDELSAPAFAVLDDREGEELVTLLTKAHATVYGG